MTRVFPRRREERRRRLFRASSFRSQPAKDEEEAEAEKAPEVRVRIFIFTFFVTFFTKKIVESLKMKQLFSTLDQGTQRYILQIDKL